MRNSRTNLRSYADARALVTGGCSGLGLELVKLLVAEGARVLVGDVHEEAPAGTLPPGVQYRQLDVRSDEQWDEARVWVETHWQGLDLLVNNAGVAAGGRIDVTSMDDWKWIVDINLLGVVRGCRTFTPMLKEQRGGQIVNTASLAGLVHSPAMASYNSVKAGVVALSETLLHELSPWNIIVTVICPSFFRTNLASSLQGKDVEMEETAVDLITKAPRGAVEVAAAAYAGMKAGKFIVLTDPDGRIAYNSKRFSRPVYTATMKRAGKSLAKGGPAIPPLVAKMQARMAQRSK
ncbi:SDR family NAD(P)-dependent oxidoreductase [Allobranchiibius sp. GilTou73]|uniref:SDR family NAD(P)-dependent oxidoreductase n=1 Tax=Allobranchiibius sp. GilTou73 TaxID=2904523 RepID=UPI001F17D4AE|nr:SDR family NAD(P)-dependent oxidoreductase [Allobranchiibius sp. GilTou73]UIJ35753.1 SDR family NAD(P)-dependent oxidoreductase [Allobranchiibius sp. GilTou73]